MKKIYFIICIFLFLQNINAQDYTKAPENSPTVILKLAPVSLFEYANCLHLAAEIRFNRFFSIQPEIGYFSDIFSNPDYLPTNSMDGMRFGNEFRFYFRPVRTDKFNWYVSSSFLWSNAKVRSNVDGSILEQGKVKTANTNINYNHSRFTGDIQLGFQRDFNRKWNIEVYTGAGLMGTGTGNIQIENPNVYLVPPKPPFSLFAIKGPFGRPSRFDSDITLNFALGVKIGYRLW
jgi:Protein of unknown function (DUF3575)